jgi:hypothetical protein
VGGVRLRQVVVAARDGHEVLDQWHTIFGLSSGYRDPGVAEFGLENHVFAVGDQFLELVSPVSAEAAVWRFLEKKGVGAAGYMVVLEVDEVAPFSARAHALGCRVVLGADSGTWSTLHLHPRDMGSLVSVDHDKGGEWAPAGPDWRDHSGASALSAIAGVRIATADPDATASRWAAFLGIPRCAGDHFVRLDRGTIEFVAAASGGEGLVAVDLCAAHEHRVGECHTIAGTEFRIVQAPPARVARGW